MCIRGFLILLMGFFKFAEFHPSDFTADSLGQIRNKFYNSGHFIGGQPLPAKEKHICGQRFGRQNTRFKHHKSFYDLLLKVMRATDHGAFLKTGSNSLTAILPGTFQSG